MIKLLKNPKYVQKIHLTIIGAGVLLTNVPIIVGLITLICSFCPLLINIPSIEQSSEGLQYLICSGCRLITNIPSIEQSSEGLRELHCSKCPWLNIQKNRYDNNITKIVQKKIIK